MHILYFTQDFKNLFDLPPDSWSFYLKLKSFSPQTENIPYI